jgi:antitoxin (DNA-binding transcriptional repressor) of toxin-antitoxin stability system
MRTIGVREFKESLDACLEEAQGESLVVMRHGHPVAVVVGVEGRDLEDIYWGLDDGLLEQMYRPPTGYVPHEEVGRRLGIQRPRR